MPRLRLIVVALAFAALGGCSFISPHVTAEAMRANPEIQKTIRVPAPPDQACAKTARMLMWCASGPNFHYRCDSAPGGGKSELSGVLEAIYRTEYFMVAEFIRDKSDSVVTVRQRDSILVHDYAPIIEKYFTKPDCQPR